MSNMKIIGCVVMALALNMVVYPAMAVEKGSKAESKTGQQWAFTADPKLPNVLILGDSISIGYTLKVRKLLAGKANVYRPLTSDGKKPENCAGTTLGAEKVSEWLGDTKWAVVHFNFGLHDLKHVTKGEGKPSSDPADPLQATVEEYSSNLSKITEKIKATGAKMIFATTTPVPAGSTTPLRETDSPGKYNEAALKILNASGVKINDLYSFVLPKLDKLQQPKNVHFTDAGSEALADTVAKAIEAELGEVK